MGCKRNGGCIVCVLFQIGWQLQTQIFKNRILSDSLLDNKLYLRILIGSKYEDAMTSSEDPDQTAPLGAVTAPLGAVTAV